MAKDFLKLVFLSILIASPIAYYLMDDWLGRFAYKVAIDGWVFVVGTAISITIAFLTVSVQAMRLALMNPAQSLRSE